MEVNRLLHPNLLSDSELLRILESLCIKVPHDLPRSQVLEIFKKVAVPLPQRSKEPKCRDVTTTLELSELSISNNKRDNDQNSSNAKKMKYHVNETKAIKDIKHQLDNVQLNDSVKIIPHLGTTTIMPPTKPASRKVVLKRAHLFDQSNDEDKRIKLY